jgi:hypothetical protein
MRSFITATALLFACAASAAVFDHLPSDAELIHRSDLVVVGTVRQAASRVQNGWIVTDYELAIEETLKGHAGSVITITEAGGTVDGRTLFISDGASYEIGERALAFLHRAPDGSYYTAFMKLGKLEFTRNQQGTSVLVRDTADFGPEPARLEREFKQFVRGTDSAPYQTTLQPITAAFQPRAEFIASDYCVVASGKPIRWAGGESGLTVHFASNASDPGGIAAGSGAWTSEPLAFINLQYDGQATSPPLGPANTSDGRNGIYLNASTGDVPAGVPCADSVACAVEWLSTSVSHTFDSTSFYSILEADILVFPGGMGGAFNAVMIHEFGHAIGLRHSNQGNPFSSTAVMNSSVSFTSLQQWDKDAADTVYGSGPPCQPIVINVQPSSGTVNSGQSAFLQVGVSGTNPQYQWYDGIKPDTSNPVSGATSATFTTPPITSVKNYWVRVTNACTTAGSADSNTATITPQTTSCTPVTITQQPVGGTINSGQTFTMSVQASGSTPFFIQWYEGQKLDRTKPVDNATSATFTTPALTQTKTYWVEITNTCPSAAQSNAVTVIVNTDGGGPGCTKPVFTIPPQSITGRLNQPAILFALATGEGTLTYQWYQGNSGDTSVPLASQTASNARWINQIYVDVLGRLPDAAAISTFTGILGGGSSRSAAALVLLTSAEYRNKLLGAWFSQYLHRPAAAADLTFFTPMFTAGFTDEQIEAQILSSAEYFTLSGGSNGTWLNHVYADVLGRAPTPAESGFFLPLLGSSSRLSVALNILNSTESRTRLVQSDFARFLRRSGGAAEVGGLLGVNDEQAAASILGSDEYFNFPSMLITSPLSATTKFWVRVSNACGPTDSPAATVTIPCDKPVITTQPANTTINVGQSVTLSVTATGADSYQWFVGAAGVESNPIAGATGPVLSGFPITTVGTTSIWVKTTNSCGSTNSAAATVTVSCAATKPVLAIPPTAPGGKTFLIFVTGPRGTSFEIQESLTQDFATPKTYITDGTSNITDGTSQTILINTPSKDTRVFYRARSITPCTNEKSGFSDVGSVLVTAPLPPNLPNYSFAQPKCNGGPCFITQLIHIDGIISAGKTALDGGDQFNIGSDKPWMTVSPSSGALPAGGADVTVTIDAAQLDIGSTQASLTLNRTQGSAKTGAFGNPPTTTVPVNVSLVAPVTTKPKDGNAPLNTLLIPAVAHADGIGTRFVSDIRLTNTASQSITYDLTFTPSNIDGTTAGKQMTITATAGQTVALNDIVKDWYGSGVEGEVGIGTIEVRPRNYAAKTGVNVSFATVAASRTYAVSSAGTFGQFIPALPVMSFLGKASNSVFSLQQVAQSSAYRTNLGLVEGLGQAANVVATLFDDHGTMLAQRALTLRPFEAQQTRLDTFFNGFTVNGAALPSIADARVEVAVTSDSGRVTTYASVLDNTTTDPLLVFPVDPANIAAKRFVVPGVAEFDNGFSNFHTDMRVYNAASAPANVTINFFGSTQLPAVQRTIPAGQVLAVDNVLGSLWNASGGGAVAITTDNDTPLVVTARTFSRDGNGGTFGQFIPGVTATDAVGVGDRTLQVVQLEQSPSFRSNLGLVEVTGNPVTVEILGFTPESKIAARVEKTLSGGEFSQLGNVFTSMGFGNVYNGRVSVRAIGGSGRVAAYGSVVDARTADPTYVPAQ